MFRLNPNQLLQTFFYSCFLIWVFFFFCRDHKCNKQSHLLVRDCWITRLSFYVHSPNFCAVHNICPGP